MADDRLKNLRGASRRDFLRWGTAVGALLGLERARFLDALCDTAGTALADGAACATTSRSVHLVGGNGGIPWFHLLWPHHEVAKAATDANGFAFLSPGRAAVVAGTDRPFVHDPDRSPFRGGGPQMSAFLGSAIENGHVGNPRNAASVGTGVGMIAAIAAMQFAASPTLLPVIAVEPAAGAVGVATGLPSVVTTSPDGLLGLFSSAASRTLLARPADASLYEGYTKAFRALSASAGRAPVAAANRTESVAAHLVGQNFGAKLAPSAEEEQRYGITDIVGLVDQDPDYALLVRLGRQLIVAVNAFGLGLTSSFILPALYNSDPHGAFARLDATRTKASVLGKLLDGFIDHARRTPDPSCNGKSLGDSIVFTVHGDIPKDPMDTTGGSDWKDQTPSDSNWLYVYGNGRLKTGWFGGIAPSGAVTSFEPTTGATVPFQKGAPKKGDMSKVTAHYSGPSIAGLVK
jgi:hypothetical protein